MAQPARRSFIKPTDLILLLAVAAAAVLVLLLYRGRSSQDAEHNLAVLTIGQQQVRTFDLADYSEPQVIDLHEEYGVTAKLEFADHAVRFIEVDCPDHICEQTGFVSRDGESAVCMPNRMAVTVYAREELP